MTIATALPFFPTTTAFADENAAPASLRLAIGVSDLGAQLRFQPTPQWAGEARFLTGSASSQEGSIHSLVFGLRGYRFFKEHRRLRLYLGLEGDRVQTSIRSVNPSSGSPITNQQGFGSTSGYAAGGFGGVEFHIARRVAVDLDMGPYLIGLKEKTTGASDSSWDFVVNAAVNIYLF